jgi:hypothetical protein
MHRRLPLLAVLVTLAAAPPAGALPVRFTGPDHLGAGNGPVSVATGLFGGSLLRPGAVIELRLTARFAIGKIKRFTIRRLDTPREQTLCLPPRSGKPRRCRSSPTR